jgi:hypothetical protein
MPRAGKVQVKGGRNIDYYEIAMRQFAGEAPLRRRAV